MGHVTITTLLLGMIFYLFDTAYLCTKFDSSSFSRSLDMNGGGLKFKMGHVT